MRRRGNKDSDRAGQRGKIRKYIEFFSSLCYNILSSIEERLQMLGAPLFDFSLPVGCLSLTTLNEHIFSETSAALGDGMDLYDKDLI